MPNKQETLQAIDDSIRHWEEMRAWVRGKIEKGHGKDRINSCIMEIRIRQSWDGDYCALCLKFYDDIAFSCCNCILAKIGEGCKEELSAWRCVDGSKTYFDWLTASDGMMDALNWAKQWVIDNLNS